jgi:ADP-ribose pyrophosphatase YjhB (NUDIX family)
MPGFTTNVEFGEDLHSGKIVYGRPEHAEKCRHLDKRMEELKLPVFTSLEDTLRHAISLLGTGVYRRNGEVYVPLFIWETELFQSSYSNLKLAGNRLEKAKLLHHVEFSTPRQVFSYVLWVKIWIEAEKRYKENEFVFARKDISTVLAYYKDNDGDIKIATVKEFRSPVNNLDGFVYELPGGSSFKSNMDPQLNAKHELEEECGVTIEDVSRFKYVGQRQLAATLSSHRAQLYSIELTKEEYEQMLKNEKSDRRLVRRYRTHVLATFNPNFSKTTKCRASKFCP